MSMDSFNFSRINPDYRTNPNPFGQQARIIDFVVLDTTEHSFGGQAFQLIKEVTFTEDELRDIKKGNFSLPKNPFSLLGEVKEVKRNSKQLVLLDENTIQYNHLVVVKGTHPTLMSYEFLAAFYTLVDALRVQKWIPEAMLPPPNLKPKVSIHAAPLASEAGSKIWIDYLPSHHPSEGTFLYAESNRKIYNVHI